jgi:uncharacterized protein (TIGR03083 family)
MGLFRGPVREHEIVTDYESAYRDLRVRVTDLLRDRSSREVEQLVPATPEWRVRDVAAHLGGVCDDIATGNMEGVGTDAWTHAQVEKRRDWELARVLDDWTEHAEAIEPMLNSLGQPIGQLVFDAWTHEQDIRGALGAPGGRDSAAAEIAFEWFRESGSTVLPGGALALVTDDGTFVLGDGEVVRTVRTTRFELLRTVTGRRSRSQMRALECDGPSLEDVLDGNDIFTAASRDIAE